MCKGPEARPVSLCTCCPHGIQNSDMSRELWPLCLVAITGLSSRPVWLHPLRGFAQEAWRWAGSQRQNIDLPSFKFSASSVAPEAASLLPAPGHVQLHSDLVGC